MPTSQDTTGSGIDSNPTFKDGDVKLVELSIVIVVDQNDPSEINPDFLSSQAIVESRSHVHNSTFSTPLLSQVAFEGGLTIRGEPNRYVFEQRKGPLPASECVIPQIVRRFVDKRPWLIYRAIGVNPKGVFRCDRIRLRNLLANDGRAMQVFDVEPNLHLKGTYALDDEKISVEIDEASVEFRGMEKFVGFYLQLNIHRDIEDANVESRVAKIKTILADWKKDLGKLHQVVTQLRLGVDR